MNNIDQRDQIDKHKLFSFHTYTVTRDQFLATEEKQHIMAALYMYLERL